MNHFLVLAWERLRTRSRLPCSRGRGGRGLIEAQSPRVVTGPFDPPGGHGPLEAEAMVLGFFPRGAESLLSSPPKLTVAIRTLLTGLQRPEADSALFEIHSCFLGIYPQAEKGLEQFLRK